nr:T cell antigen receptor alpha chain CDR3 region=TCR V alpha 8.4 product [mice, C57BL/6, B16 murine melanoma cells, tumor-infiltrating lymphocytes, Peptide Partial, 24 aa] [Mus sp.]
YCALSRNHGLQTYFGTGTSLLVDP